MGKKGFLANLAYTLAVRRTPLRWRIFLLTNSPEDFINLDTKMSYHYQQSTMLHWGLFSQDKALNGLEWGMVFHLSKFFGRALKTRKTISGTLGVIGCFVVSCWLKIEDFYLHDVDELFKDSKRSSINKPEFSQPLCTAIQVALVDLLQSFGVQPTAVVGHSSGEIAAA